MPTIIETQAQARDTRHVEGVMFRCGDCGEVKPVQSSGGTGYGYFGHDNPDAKPICYDCCGKRDVAAMTATGRATLYMSKTKGADWNKCEVANWPGTLRLAGGYSVGRHNIAGKRYDVHFTGPDGAQWHGVTYGDNTQICHCKRLKARAA